MTIIQDIITFQSGHLIIMRRAYRFKSLHVFFRHQTCNDYNYGHRNIAQLSDALIKMHKYLYICMYILIRRLHIFHKLDLFLISWLLCVSIFLTTTRTYILNSKLQKFHKNGQTSLFSVLMNQGLGHQKIANCKP